MNKGRATRIYSIDRDKLREAIESMEKEIAEMTEQKLSSKVDSQKEVKK